MKRFTCMCGNRVFFDNTHCLRCGRMLGFLPDLRKMSAIEPVEADTGVWRTCRNDEHDGRRYRQCLHYSREQVCNWMVPMEDPQTFCLACRLNRTIPDLSVPGNRQYWAQLESAKRYMLYGVMQLGLPVHGKDTDERNGLAFTFLADEEYGNGEVAPVLTGHTRGIITVNVAEADHVHREAMRVRMGEPYRTLLGHFRHEVGHYYWERLVHDGGRLKAFRTLFGDERQDYQDALQRHHANPRRDWEGDFISAYASCHPWEDWAETWAHYLHLQDGLETAQNLGLYLDYADPSGAVQPCADEPDFDIRMGHWIKLTVAMNSLSRSMGSPDIYPFTIGPGLVEKFRFVDGVVRESGERREARGE